MRTEPTTLLRPITDKIAAPAYRHATPSGPWPWMNIDSNPEPPATPTTPLRDPTNCSHTREECGRCWAGYPESLFPNWKPPQVERCRMKDKVAESERCVIHHIDIKDDATFVEFDPHIASAGWEDDFWELMQEPRPNSLRLRALFLEDLSQPVLEMLGTKYEIEPFFFSSSINWIPSRFQENARPRMGDHITVTLTFLHPIKIPSVRPSSTSDYDAFVLEMSPERVDDLIDTQAPLRLHSGTYDLASSLFRQDFDHLSLKDDPQREDRLLLLDLLAIHMIRSPSSSTIISYHPPHDRQIPPQRSQSARKLHNRTYLAGQSVYWQNIFKKAEDPTLVLLAILWHALYAWDEAVESLWVHIAQQEAKVINTNDVAFTEELHRIRAHLLHYKALLDDFEKTVRFVRDTSNPAMESHRYSATTRETSQDLLEQECTNLQTEVKRLKKSMEMQEMRLRNVTDLVFGKVNIEDSTRMRKLTEATVRDSEAMKQIAYLTMFFLPANFCTGVFGMNIIEINPNTFGTLSKYFATAIPLTTITIWVVVALQGRWHDPGTSGISSWFMRLSWPALLVIRLISSVQPRFKNSRPWRR